MGGTGTAVRVVQLCGRAWNPRSGELGERVVMGGGMSHARVARKGPASILSKRRCMAANSRCDQLRLELDTKHGKETVQVLLPHEVFAAVMGSTCEKLRNMVFLGTPRTVPRMLREAACGCVFGKT